MDKAPFSPEATRTSFSKPFKTVPGIAFFSPEADMALKIFSRLFS